jgi:nitrate/TMAO reductase-like tetraheme cytochrome c subunit
VKRVIVILFFGLLGTLLSVDTVTRFNASTPGRGATLAAQTPKVDYSKFKHSTHAGEVKTHKGDATQKLDCAYCHSAPTADNPDVLRAYPSKKQGLKTGLTHSACLDCHAFGGRQAMDSGMCSICHQNNRLTEMAKNLRPFPQPQTIESQFYDRYSHDEHTGYFEASDKFKERFSDKKKFKEKDNFECLACHESNKEKVEVAGIQFAPGVRENAPGHAQCFACHFDKKEVGEKKTSFAANCIGCHAAEAKKAGKGSELAVHWFVRQIINTEKNPPPTTGKPTKPFSHKTHEENVGKDTKTCLDCHATGKKAEKRSDFFAEDRKTKEKQPRTGNCVECHHKEMQQTIGGEVKLETSKCAYCHSIQTIKERAAAGSPTPPPNHFAKKATPSPSPKPSATPSPTPKFGLSVR